MALNAALTLSGRTARVPRGRGNPLPNVLYWPVPLGMIFAATVWSFA